MKWADGDTKDYSPKDIYIFPDGADITIDTKKCNCANPDYGDTSLHEPYCGLEYLGTMENVDWNDDPTMLWSMAWDFTQI
ncbi:hypothetical protein [Nocardia phage P3.1]|nr:hypothetical protein [Nocardia phage P3.1]